MAELAHIGDSIETAVRHPMPQTIRVILVTSEACAAGNELLLDDQSGWCLVRNPQYGDGE